jgi:hypothetical protein
MLPQRVEQRRPMIELDVAWLAVDRQPHFARRGMAR